MHRSLPSAIGSAAPYRARVQAPCVRPARDHHKPFPSPPPSAPSHHHLPRRPLPHPPRAKPWRPLADDVERLSSGGAAKRRGTGSFHVPHRLSQDERPPFVAAKKNGYLTIRGSGGRRGNKRGGGKGSGRPLLNVWRQWCDAKGWACVVVEQAAGVVVAAAAGYYDDGDDQQQQQASSSSSAVVIVDFSTLRLLDARSMAAKARAVVEAATAARELGPFERGDGEVPFDVVATSGSGALLEAAAEAPEVPDFPSSDDQEGDALEKEAAAAAAAAVPGRVPLRRAAEGETSNDATAPPSALPDGHPYATSAIWSIPAQPLFFAVEGDASGAKNLAAELAKALNGGAGGGGGGGGSSSGNGAKKSSSSSSKASRRRVFDDYE